MEHFKFEMPSRHPSGEGAGRQIGSDLVRHKHTHTKEQKRDTFPEQLHMACFCAVFPSFFPGACVGCAIAGDTHSVEAGSCQ